PWVTAVSMSSTERMSGATLPGDLGLALGTGVGSEATASGPPRRDHTARAANFPMRGSPPLCCEHSIDFCLQNVSVYLSCSESQKRREGMRPPIFAKSRIGQSHRERSLISQGLYSIC